MGGQKCKRTIDRKYKEVLEYLYLVQKRQQHTTWEIETI